MKNFLLCFLLFPFAAFAQDTCQLKKESDPFTHQAKITTGFVPFVINGKQVSISVDATATEIDFFFWLRNDDACFDTESTVQVNYEGDRLKANFKNTGSMNCEGAFHFSFRNTASTPSNLQRLADKRISSIKLNGPNKKVTELVLNNEQKQQLMKMTACVLRDAKTLRP